MSELLTYYKQAAKAKFSTIPWLLDMQKNAVADFTRMGFPTRYMEDWKYTLVDSFLQQRFVNEQSAITPAYKTALPIGFPMLITNGGIAGIDALSLPNGVIIQPLVQAIAEHSEKVKPYLNQILQQEHGFHALNTAMLSSGLFIYVPKDTCLTMPLHLSHWQDKANQASHVRHLIVLEEGSLASVIEDFHGDNAACYFTNSITEVHVAAHATLHHYKIQRESNKAYHIGHIAVHQAANSQFDSHSFSLGGKLVRSDITIGLNEPKARCLMNGVYAPGDGQHMDHHTIVKHEAPDCKSEQDYKGILNGHSRAVFNGRVIVAKHAQHTEAKQQNKNLLLSTNTEIDTKPQLEIFADDVVCTHGATVGHLDEDALFYLATRGIGKAEATRYLVQAFTHDNLRRVGNAALAEWLGALLTVC